MSMVSVPVPEEYVVEVKAFVRRLAEPVQRPWDEDAARQLFMEADPVVRSVLSFVARTAHEGRATTQAEVGERLDLDAGEVGMVLLGLIAYARQLERELAYEVKTVIEIHPDGTEVENLRYVMKPEVAEWILAGEQAAMHTDAS